jgi:putative membrane protein
VAEPIKKQTEQVERVVKQVEQSTDRSTVLAADRTIFAAERTYAAWVRTGLTALAAGVGAKAALGHVMNEAIILATGTMLVVFAAFCFAAGVWRELFPGAPPPEPDVRKLPAALLLLVNGFLVLIAFIALAGIWIARTPGS